MLRHIFFLVSPFLIYTISGNSMNPTYTDGEKVIVLKKWVTTIQPNSVVVAKDPRDARVLIKRVQQIKNNSYFLVGDNATESTDSRDFGWIKKDVIIGKVISHT